MSDVLIVDDAEIGCMGWVAAVEAAGHRARAQNWSSAGRGLDQARDVGVVILALRRDPQSWDRYGALAQAAQLRTDVGPACRLVVVLDLRETSNAMLCLRLAGIGVDEVVSSHQVQTKAAVADLVEGRLVGPSPRPAPVELAARRVGKRSDPNRVIAHVGSLLHDPAYGRAFDPDVRQNQSGLTRRQALRLRRTVCELADLSPDRSSFTGGPVRDRTMARWSDMVAFVNDCRGWDPDDDQIGLVDHRDRADGSGQRWTSA